MEQDEKAPAAPRDIFDAEGIAALINRFGAALIVPNDFRHVDGPIIEHYSSAVIRVLAAQAGYSITQAGTTHFEP
jgi:hypothetical protein